MGNNYQLISPVLVIISIGLVAYLIYLISLMLFGSTLRAAENVILILVVIGVVVVVIIVIREQIKIREKSDRIWWKVEEIIKSEGEEEGKPEKEKAEVLKKELKEEVKAEFPKKEPEGEKTKKPRFSLKFRPGILRKERPKIDKERLEEISRLFKIGIELMNTDAEGAKEAFTKAKNIYNSLSAGEKKLIDDEIIKIKEFKELHDKIAKESRKEKG